MTPAGRRSSLRATFLPPLCRNTTLGVATVGLVAVDDGLRGWRNAMDPPRRVGAGRRGWRRGRVRITRWGQGACRDDGSSVVSPVCDRVVDLGGRGEYDRPAAAGSASQTTPSKVPTLLPRWAPGALTSASRDGQGAGRSERCAWCPVAATSVTPAARTVPPRARSCARRTASRMWAQLRRATGASSPPTSATRSAAASSISRPRRPAETWMVGKDPADVSTTIGIGRRVPRGEIPPRT
jgi:hypothetical protein